LLGTTLDRLPNDRFAYLALNSEQLVAGAASAGVISFVGECEKY